MKPEVEVALAKVCKKYKIEPRHFGPGEREKVILEETLEVAAERNEVKWHAANPNKPVEHLELTEDMVRMVPGGSLD